MPVGIIDPMGTSSQFSVYIANRDHDGLHWKRIHGPYKVRSDADRAAEGERKARSFVCEVMVKPGAAKRISLE